MSNRGRLSDGVVVPIHITAQKGIFGQKISKNLDWPQKAPASGRFDYNRPQKTPEVLNRPQSFPLGRGLEAPGRPISDHIRAKNTGKGT